MDKISYKPELMDCFKAELSEEDFNVFSRFIYSEFGIKMPPIKRVMLQGRLLKRIRDLGLNSYTDYKKFLFSKEGQDKELLHFLSVVTTNKTDFFREPGHFIFLNDEVLAEFVPSPAQRSLKVWSAGCSSGEEPYTISIVLNEFERLNPFFKFEILGTDISSNVLEKAARGVYSLERISPIPLELKKRYFLRSKDSQNHTVRVSPLLQKNLRLAYLNLMDPVYDVKDTFDIIFCRNVLIYFDRATQEKVIVKLCNHLKPGGYFFIGHSESLSGMTVPLEHVKPTIFRKK
jgi:chemotaxis protein methyltransferase CheR